MEVLRGFHLEERMELSDMDKEIMKDAVGLLWRKGANNPQEAAAALRFTQLVERVSMVVPEPPKAKKEG